MDLSAACKNVLDQLSSITNEINEIDFIKPVPSLNQSTLGQHIRHTLEFFISLIDGYNTGFVSYDKRKHDKNLEIDKSLALSVIQKVILFLDKNPVDKEFMLEACYDPDSDISQSVKSTYYRELAYNIEHAIHHMAIIKIGIQEICPYVQIPEGFGVAVSTIKYNKTQTQAQNS